MKNKIVVGIDQSYADTGISIGYNGKLKQIGHCYLKNLKSNTERRRTLNKRLRIVFNAMSQKSQKVGGCEVICIIERIRLQSAQPNEKHFLNFPYIKGIGALNAMIVDLADEYDIPVYSVDTRSWKAQVIGSCKPMPNKYFVAPEKWPTVKYMIAHGWEEYLKDPASTKKRNCIVNGDERYTYNDNTADSAGICLYGFLPSNKQHLELEY